MRVPAIFEIDPDTNEANGTVHFFCSEECRGKAHIELPWPDTKLFPGLSDPGTEEDVCETCCKCLMPERAGKSFYRHKDGDYLATFGMPNWSGACCLLECRQTTLRGDISTVNTGLIDTRELVNCRPVRRDEVPEEWLKEIEKFH